MKILVELDINIILILELTKRNCTRYDYCFLFCSTEDSEIISE